MSDGIKIPITVEDKDALAALNRTKEATSKLGASVSGLGSVMGRSSSMMGQLVNEAGNLYYSLGALNGAGLALLGGAGLGMAIVKISEYMLKAQEASQKLNDERLDRVVSEYTRLADAARGSADRVDDIRKKTQDLGKSAIQLAYDNIELRRKEAEAEKKTADTMAQARLEEIRVLFRTKIMSVEKINELAAEREEINALQVVRDNVQKRVMANLDDEEQAVLEFETKKEYLRQKEENDRRRKAAAEKKRNEDERRRLFSPDDSAPSRSKPGKFTLTAAEYEAEFQKKLDKEKQDRDKKAALDVANFQISLREKIRDIDDEERERRKSAEKQMYKELADYGVAQLKSVGDFALGEVVSRNDIETRLAEARKRGDKDRVMELEEQRLQSEETVAARVIERLSAEAIGQGVTLAARGIGEAVLGNPGGLAAAGIGVALATAGVAGTIASGNMISASGARAETRAYSRQQQSERDRTAPTGSIGVGSAQAGGQQVFNYYFGGPVFGSGDDAARAVARFNARGQRLEGRQ